MEGILRSVKRSPFTRPPRNRSWRPSCSRTRSTKEATGMSEAGRSARGRKRTPHATHRSDRRSGDARRETRSSPVSLASKGPELLGVVSHAFGREACTQPRRCVGGHEAKASESRASAGSLRGAHVRNAAPGNDDVTGTRVTVVSECRSRSAAMHDRESRTRERSREGETRSSSKNHPRPR